MLTSVLGRTMGRVAVGRIVERTLGRALDPFATSLREMLDPYRPELHYMRGPGPKWHERHDERCDARHGAR